MKRQKRNESSDMEQEESSLPTGSQAEGDLDTVEEDLELQDDDSGSDDDDE